MYRVLQAGDKLPNPLDNIPITKNDGTLRFFLNLSDDSDIEDLAKVPKIEPQNDAYTIEKDGDFKTMPLPILEQLLGISNLSEDEEEQKKILAFIKKQTSFGEEFKRKYRGFPQVFYDELDNSGNQNIKCDTNE